MQIHMYTLTEKRNAMKIENMNELPKLFAALSAKYQGEISFGIKMTKEVIAAIANWAEKKGVSVKVVDKVNNETLILGMVTGGAIGGGIGLLFAGGAGLIGGAVLGAGIGAAYSMIVVEITSNNTMIIN